MRHTIITASLLLLSICTSVLATTADLKDLGEHFTDIQLVNEAPGYHLWGSSPVIGEDGKVHLFTARWPTHTNKPLNGFTPYWKLEGEIAHYVGESETGPFTYSDIAAKTLGPEFMSPHNSTIHKVGDQFVLIFIVNQNGEPDTQRIIMYLSKSVYGPWQPANREAGSDGTILETPDEPGIWSSGSDKGVSNPAFVEANGKFYIYYRTKYPKSTNTVFGVAVADQLEGPYRHHPEPVTDASKSVEDAYAFFVNDTFYLVTTDHKNMFKTSDTGKVQNVGIVMWSSKDPCHFSTDTVVKVVEPISAYLDNSTLEQSKRYRGAKFERPQFLTNKEGWPVRLYAPVGFNPHGGDGTVVYTMGIHLP